MKLISPVAIEMKLITLFIFAQFLVFCSNSKQEPLLHKTEWLLGTWENRTKDGPVYEAWSKQDGLLSGQSFAIHDGDTHYFEFIHLKEENNTLLYIPTVIGQNNGAPVSFKLTSLEKDKLQFENTEHDFPQRISYKRISTDSLIAEISGSHNGEIKRIRFPMRRIK